MANDKRLDIAISFGPKGTVYGCGHTLDTFLYAYDICTEDELHNDCNLEDAYSEAMRGAFKEFDFEESLTKLLNEKTKTGERGAKLAYISQGTVDASPYLLGDYVRINDPRLFAELVTDYKDEQEAMLFDYEEREKMTPDLLKAINEALEWSKKYYHDEWLNGDRSDDGVLDQLSKKMFGSRGHISWDATSDNVIIEVYDEDLREWYRSDLEEEDPLPSADEIVEAIKRDILHKAKNRAESDKRKRLAQAAERVRLDAYRKEQEAERLKELKAEAVKRKKEKAGL